MPVLWPCWHSRGCALLIYCKGGAAFEDQAVDKNTMQFLWGNLQGNQYGQLFIYLFISIYARVINESSHFRSLGN